MSNSFGAGASAQVRNCTWRQVDFDDNGCILGECPREYECQFKNIPALAAIRPIWQPCDQDIGVMEAADQPLLGGKPGNSFGDTCRNRGFKPARYRHVCKTITHQNRRKCLVKRNLLSGGKCFGKAVNAQCIAHFRQRAIV